MAGHTTKIENIFNRLDQKTMKWSSYFQVYQDLIHPFAGSKITLVEVGVLNGGSLFMWREFLGKDARIIGVDNNPNAKKMERHGFEIFIGDQSSTDFWDQFFADVGSIDVLVDDGGHTNKQQIVTNEACLAHINDGGMIITEDTHASYMRSFGNPSKYNFVNYAKHIADCIQTRNPHVRQRSGNTFADKVYAVTFYESIVCLRIDRRRCAASKIVEAGFEHIEAQDFRHQDHLSIPSRIVEAIAAKVPNAGLRRRIRDVQARINGKLLQLQLILENLSMRDRFGSSR